MEQDIEGSVNMHDKKKQILDTALQLFAQKGFRATSIQDIADQIGIAKGSIYIYFKSKEELFVSALQLVLDRVGEQCRAVVSDNRLSPREKVERLVRIQLESGNEYHDVFWILAHESTALINGQIMPLLWEFRANTLTWLSTGLRDIYGEHSEPYIWEGAALILGITQNYALIMNPMEIDNDQILAFVMERLDDCMIGMMRKQKPPIVDEASIKRFFALRGRAAKQPSWGEYLQQIRKLIELKEPDKLRRDEWHSYLLVLEHELNKVQPVPTVIHALIATLRGFGLKAAQGPLNELEQMMNDNKPSEP